MKNFAVIGIGGYIAPRHLKAIKETGNRVVAALDPHDSVGIIDSYFPDAAFFTEFERFDRHIEKLKRLDSSHQVDYVTICSPNYLHDAHVRFALRVGADVICEKPLVLNPWNIDALQYLEEESHHTINTILQLRLHPAMQELKQYLSSGKTRHQVELTYITARGKWYQYSWKGIESKSGGLVTNIGIHFFDILTWLFGSPQEVDVHLRTPHKTSGYLNLRNADINWYLSVDADDLPHDIMEENGRTHRILQIDGHQVEFTQGFEDLHTKCYKEILSGNGFSLDDVRPSINLVHEIRNLTLSEYGPHHPLLRSL